MEGVAPAWVGLAECDPLVDEGLAVKRGAERRHGRAEEQRRRRRRADPVIEIAGAEGRADRPGLAGTRLVREARRGSGFRRLVQAPAGGDGKNSEDEGAHAERGGSSEGGDEHR